MALAIDWQSANARHLGLALETLRARLRQRVAESEPGDDSPEKTGIVRRRLWGALSLGETPAEDQQFSPDAFTDVLARNETQIRELEEVMDQPPALCELSKRLGLSPFESDVLLLCAGMELDPNIGPLCAQALHDPQRPYPTFAVAMRIFDAPEWSALAPHRPLRRWRLLEIHQPANTPLVAAGLSIDERILHYLKGLNYLDDRLDALVSELTFPEGGLSASQRSVGEGVVWAWRMTAESKDPLPVIQFLGSDPTSKQLVASYAAQAVGRHLYRLPADQLAQVAGEVELLARLWERESRLLPIALYLDTGSELSASLAQIIRRFLGEDDYPALMAVREPVELLDRPMIAVEVTRPTNAEQTEAWQKDLGLESAEAAGRLSSQFDLNLPSIQQVGRSAHSELPVNSSPETLARKVWDICRAEARPRVDGLAQPIEAKATWNDLVLPPSTERVLRQLVAQVRHRVTVYNDWGFARITSRGLGVSALFCGASGTGKTMAAEVLANELELDLFRIDLSSVVNKYIGETEKNLRKLFDSFEESGAVLFFDEADALFGKRTEVRDSHDRYANLEVSYLLQRMESYRGLAILATNFRSALDQAFLRRLRFVVDFPMPGTNERRRIWTNLFSTADSSRLSVPSEGLDFARLARLELAGGNIFSAALSAAFRAAEIGHPVTMTEVLAAVRDEYLKLDRPVHESEFRA